MNTNGNDKLNFGINVGLMPIHDRWLDWDFSWQPAQIFESNLKNKLIFVIKVYR